MENIIHYDNWLYTFKIKDTWKSLVIYKLIWRFSKNIKDNKWEYLKEFRKDNKRINWFWYELHIWYIEYYVTKKLIWFKRETFEEFLENLEEIYNRTKGESLDFHWTEDKFWFDFEQNNVDSSHNILKEKENFFSKNIKQQFFDSLSFINKDKLETSIEKFKINKKNFFTNKEEENNYFDNLLEKYIENQSEEIKRNYNEKYNENEKYLKESLKETFSNLSNENQNLLTKRYTSLNAKIFQDWQDFYDLVEITCKKYFWESVYKIFTERNYKITIWIVDKNMKTYWFNFSYSLGKDEQTKEYFSEIIFWNINSLIETKWDMFFRSCFHEFSHTFFNRLKEGTSHIFWEKIIVSPYWKDYLQQEFENMKKISDKRKEQNEKYNYLIISEGVVEDYSLFALQIANIKLEDKEYKKLFQSIESQNYFDRVSLLNASNNQNILEYIYWMILIKSIREEIWVKNLHKYILPLLWYSLNAYSYISPEYLFKAINKMIWKILKDDNKKKKEEKQKELQDYENDLFEYEGYNFW